MSKSKFLEEEDLSLRRSHGLYDGQEYGGQDEQPEPNHFQARLSFKESSLRASCSHKALRRDAKDQLLPEGLESLGNEPPHYLSRQSSRWSSRPPSYMSAPRQSMEKTVRPDELARSAQRSPHIPLYQRPVRIPSLLHRVLLASPAIVSFFIWDIMLIYFQVWYLSQPRQDDGSFRRIGFTYGGYPFVSCIGAIESAAFKICCSIVAICTLWVFACDFWIGLRARYASSMKGHAWLYITARSLKLFAALCGSAFLIALSYANVEDGSQHDTHLILVTLQVLGMGGTRFWDFFVSREIVKRLDACEITRPKSMIRSKRAKNAEAVICMIGTVVLLPAIYGCSSDFEVLDLDSKAIKQSAHCYGLLSYAAVLEWIMSVSWSFYMLSTAWDLVFLWEWIELLERVPAEWKNNRAPRSRKYWWHKLSRSREYTSAIY